MAETESDIMKGSSGSYNRSSYPDADWPSGEIKRPKYSVEYPAGLLGPECLLNGHARPTIPMIHTVGDMERAEAKKSWKI